MMLKSFWTSCLQMMNWLESKGNTKRCRWNLPGVKSSAALGFKGLGFKCSITFQFVIKGCTFHYICVIHSNEPDHQCQMNCSIISTKVVAICSEFLIHEMNLWSGPVFWHVGHELLMALFWGFFWDFPFLTIWWF